MHPGGMATPALPSLLQSDMVCLVSSLWAPLCNQSTAVSFWASKPEFSNEGCQVHKSLGALRAKLSDGSLPLRLEVFVAQN